MFVDFGRNRGRVYFTWKELVAIWTLLLSGAAYVMHTEVAFSDLRAQLDACKRSVQELKQVPRSNTYVPSTGGEEQ